MSKIDVGPVSDKDLVLVHVPALVAVLLNKEREKGAPLTQDEVISITNDANCIAMPLFAKQEVEKGRGYADIDPENAWFEWQLFRQESSDQS